MAQNQSGNTAFILTAAALVLLMALWKKIACNT
jgi:hypothetical protein